MTTQTILEHATPRTAGTCAGAIVLRNVGGYMPFATHWRNDDLGGFIWGHYFKDIEEARADYEARCARGY